MTALGELIYSLNPYTELPHDEITRLATGKMELKMLPDPSGSAGGVLQNVTVDVGSYELKWTFKGQELNVKTTARIPFRFPVCRVDKDGKSTLLYWQTESLLIGFSGAGGGAGQHEQAVHGTATTQSHFTRRTVTTISIEPSAEIRRLIVEGPPPIDGPRMGATLRNLAGPLGFIYIAEMSEYLAQRGVSLGRYTNLVQYHLIGVPDGDVFGLLGRLFREPTLAPSITRIEPDLVFALNQPSPSLGSNFDLRASGCSHAQYCADMDVPKAHNASITGQGVRIAIIDTGAHANLLTTRFYDLVKAGNQSYVDDNGHGTAMASIVKEVAPDAEIFAVRITDSDTVHLWDVMAGLQTAALDIKADIINMSLGCKLVDRECTRCGGFGNNRSLVFENQFKSIRLLAQTPGNPDPVFVASVGNDGLTTGFEWPARYDTTLAVGAVDKGFQRSSFSNTGTQKGGYLLCPGGEWDNKTNQATEWVGQGTDANGNTTYCVGTSPAAAYASGVLALYRQHFVDGLVRAGDAAGLTSSALLDETYNRCKQDVQPSYRSADDGLGRLVFDDKAYP
jgi:hypothetical protein